MVTCSGDSCACVGAHNGSTGIVQINSGNVAIDVKSKEATGIGGVFILGLGLLAYFIAGSMINKFTDIVDQFGSFPLSSPIDVSVGSFGSPVIYISYAMMAVGGLFIIAGVILALVLKKKLQHKDS